MPHKARPSKDLSEWSRAIIRRIAVLTGIALLWMSFDFPAQADDLIVEKRHLPCPATPRLPARPSNRSRSAGNRRARSIAINRTRFSSRISFPAQATPSANTAAVGYWDAIIGPGKAIDTNRYFVLSSDTLINLNVFTAIGQGADKIAAFLTK